MLCCVVLYWYQARTAVPMATAEPAAAAVTDLYFVALDWDMVDDNVDAEREMESGRRVRGTVSDGSLEGGRRGGRNQVIAASGAKIGAGTSDR